MTDLDNTQIISADESLLQNTSTIDTEASLKIISGADSNTYQIGKETIIGRSNPSDLVIPAPSLSKQHAKITINNGQYFITDLGSSNKTFQNKVQLQANVCYALHDGDEIKLGDIVCGFHEQKSTKTNNNVITETNVDVISSTQTITDSYDDEEPTQPMKIWNGNTNNSNRLSRTSAKNSDEVTLKQNGLNESSSNKSSSFISTSAATTSHDDNEDESLVIGGATLPATVPLIVEPTQLHDNDQLEIISSSQIKKNIDEDDRTIPIEIITTKDDDEVSQAQTQIIQTTGEIISSNNQIAETQKYEIESEQVVTDIVETKREQTHHVVISGDTMVEKITTTTTTTTTTIVNEDENRPMETLNYELQPATEEITTTISGNENPPLETLAYALEPATEQITTTVTKTTTVIENENVPMNTLAYDLEPTTEQITTTVIETENPPMDSSAYDLEPINQQITTTIKKTTVIETENLQMQTLAYDLEPRDEQIKEINVVERENPPMQTLAYDLEPGDEQIITTTIKKTTETETIIPPMQTLAYDLEPGDEQITTTTMKNTDPMEKENPLTHDPEQTNKTSNIHGSAPAVCADTLAYNLDEEINDVSPRPGSETLEIVPVSKLVEQLNDVESVIDDTSSKQNVEVTIDQEAIKEAVADEHMETDQIEHPTTVTKQEPIAITTDNEKQENVSKTEDKVDKTTEEIVEPIKKEQETALDMNKSFNETPMESEQKSVESTESSLPEEAPSSTLHIDENEQEEPEEEVEEIEETATKSTRSQRGVPRRAARRARGRRGGAARARVVSTRIHGGRRNAIVPSVTEDDGNNATLEETVNSDTDESPEKSITTSDVEQKSNESKSTPVSSTTPTVETSTTNPGSNIRVSARIKARASSGRNRQFPYADDYVDLDDLEKHSKASNISQAATTTTTTIRKSTRGGRSSSTPQKRISLRQQPIDASESSDEKSKKQNDNTDIYEQMDTGGENEEPVISTRTAGRKRKSTTPVTTATTKRTRPTTPPSANTRRKQASTTEQTTPSPSTIPKRGRKSTKTATPTEETTDTQTITNIRPVRIALSSHLNFDQTHLETLRKLGFEIMDESCQVDALVVDRIRRTKKFFMCLARGAHILSPTWIETMIKENRYVPFDKYYLDDSNAETRYGFQLRESVRLAKQHPIFENYKIFCTKDTSPPYDDLKDIIEAAGGTFIDKINMNKPGKDLICIVGQTHKNEYEDLYKKGVPIVSEEFALSGISKQKLDFDSFSLFQTGATTVKPSGSK